MPPTVIRDLQEAREALAEVLSLPERPQQIILIMEKVMSCRTPDARRFLGDAMAGLVQNGLEYMRRRRRQDLEALARKVEEEAKLPDKGRIDTRKLKLQIRDALARQREEAVRQISAAEGGRPAAEAPPEFEPILIVPSDQELKDVEELGTQLDSINLAKVAQQIYPQLDGTYDRWLLARAIYKNEAEMREAILAGARLRGPEREARLGPAFERMKPLVDRVRPEWASAVGEIRTIVERHFAALPATTDRASAESVTEIIAMHDDRTAAFLDAFRRGPGEAVGYVADLRARLDQLLELESERSG